MRQAARHPAGRMSDFFWVRHLVQMVPGTQERRPVANSGTLQPGRPSTARCPAFWPPGRGGLYRRSLPRALVDAQGRGLPPRAVAGRVGRQCRGAARIPRARGRCGSHRRPCWTCLAPAKSRGRPRSRKGRARARARTVARRKLRFFLGAPHSATGSRGPWSDRWGVQRYFATWNVEHGAVSCKYEAQEEERIEGG